MPIYLMMIDGDEEKQKFEQVYQANYLKLYHVALRILQNPSDAENAVHDTFLRLAENFSKYSSLSCSDMTALCVTITKNRSIDMLRRQRHLSVSDTENLILNRDPDLSPEDAVLRKSENRDRQARLDAALSALPENYRQVLILKYYFALSNSRIAQLTDTSPKTVGMRLYRAKKQLRELLSREGWLENEQ